MKYGICTNLKNIETVKKCGFDYIELPVGDIVNMNENELKSTIELFKDLSLPASACNCLFPGDIRLCGEAFSIDKIKEHVKKAFYNGSVLGVENFSLGSGYQRHIEPDDDFEKCMEQFKTAVIEIADLAKENNVTVALEPLNKSETNVINTVSDGAVLVRELNKSNLKLMADTYHMDIESEDYSAISDNKDIICHIHIANPNGRLFPKPGDGIDYNKIFTLLNDISYNGKLSIEANSDNLEEDCMICRKMLK